MDTVFLQMCPSSISEVWSVHLTDKPLRKKLKIPVTRIVDKIITPILSADVEDVEGVFSEKIRPFREYWLDVIQNAPKSRDWKQKPHMNLEFYDRTLAMVNSNPIFDKDKSSISDTVEILKDYETNIYSIIAKRPRLLRDALKEIDVEDLLNSIYGPYMALMCFWSVARNEKRNQKNLPALADISLRLAIMLDGYIDTLDIMTNPEEMEMMNRAQHWESYKLQNKAH